MDPDETSDNSALAMAACRGHELVTRLLLEAGASRDLAANNGETALMLASHNGHLEVVRLLLECGADKDLVMNDGRTAGQLLCWHLELAILKWCVCFLSPG